MHIGVDATCWQNNRGYGRHARALLSALIRLDPSDQYTLVVDSAERIATVPAEAKVRLVKSSAPTAVAASSHGSRSIADMWHMSSALSDPGFDLVLFPTIYSYVPVLTPAKKVVVIHDAIAEKYPKLTLPSPAARLFWRTKSALGRWQADAIATVSDFSRDQLVEHLRIPPERVFVVGEASDSVFCRRPVLRPLATLDNLGIGPQQRTIVFVGGFGPHKNLLALVDVFAHLCQLPDLADLALVLVGEYVKEVFHSQYQELQQRIAALGITDRVVFTGYVSDDDLVDLLNVATVLVLPSLMEGFGLPAIEAAACGCPVIATDQSPLPNLLGDGGLYIDPFAPQTWSAPLKRVLESNVLRQQMREAGLAAAARLTWDAAALQMHRLIHQVAS